MHSLSGAAAVLGNALRILTPRGLGGIIECSSGILLRDLVVFVRDLHLINNLLTNKSGRLHHTGLNPKTHRIDIQIRVVCIRDRVRDRHRMQSRIGSPKTGEKDLLENICARIPVVGVSCAVEGSIVRSMVIPLGAVYPNRGAVEIQRGGGPEYRREGERAVMVIPRSIICNRSRMEERGRWNGMCSPLP